MNENLVEKNWFKTFFVHSTESVRRKLGMLIWTLIRLYAFSTDFLGFWVKYRKDKLLYWHVNNYHRKYDNNE